MKKKQLKQQRDGLRNECDKLLCDLIDSEYERDALQTKLDIADKAIHELYAILVPYVEAHDVSS